jgi:hypothetical protein
METKEPRVWAADGTHFPSDETGESSRGQALFLAANRGMGRLHHVGENYMFDFASFVTCLPMAANGERGLNETNFGW